MRTITSPTRFLLVAAGFLLVHLLPSGLMAQRTSAFKVGGPCMACGGDRIIGLVKALDGVTSAQFDASTSMLTVNFDPVSASLVDIQLELSLAGYDAGDFTRDTQAKIPDCAKGTAMRGDVEEDVPGIDDIEGLEKDTDWENPDSFDVAGNAVSDDDDLTIPEDEEEDDSILDIGGDDLDVENPVDMDEEDEDEDDL